jgi:outer membrane protein assembly factor BamB
MRNRMLVAGIALLLAASPAAADDWPQFRGPKRDGLSAEKNLLTVWPKTGPKLAWTFKNAGLGFSSAAIVSNIYYTCGTRGDNEIVLALDAADNGAELWTAKIGPIVNASDNAQWGDGPRSTPTIDGNRLYALGSQGDLVCLEICVAPPGAKELWRKNLAKDLGGEMMSGWGYSESSLVDGPHVIVTPGGPKGTLAALDKMTGTVVWRSKELTNLAPYSSIMAADFHKVRQYVQTSYIDEKKGGVVSGIGANDGKLLWSQSIFKGHSYAIAPNPIIKGNRVYVTSAGGCHLFEIDANQKAKELYSKANQKNLKSNHGGVVLMGEHIFGHSEDLGWVCQELATGNGVWDERAELESGSGATIGAAGKLYLYTDAGIAGLVDADPKGFSLVSSFKIPQRSQFPRTRTSSKSARAWAHPAIANGHLYLRDAEFIFCYDIRDKK